MDDEIKDHFNRNISDSFVRARRNFVLMSSLFYIFIFCDGEFSEEYKNSYFGITLKEADNLIWVCVAAWFYFLLRYIQNSEKMLHGFIYEWIYGINYKIKYFKELIIKYFSPEAFHTKAHGEHQTFSRNIDINEFRLDGSNLYFDIDNKKRISRYDLINLNLRKLLYCTFNTNPYLFEYVFPLVYGLILVIVFPYWFIDWDNLYTSIWDGYILTFWNNISDFITSLFK